MKTKRNVLGLIAGLVILSCSSCGKLACRCEVTAQEQGSDADNLLFRCMPQCETIAETGPVTENGATVTCTAY